MSFSKALAQQFPVFALLFPEFPVFLLCLQGRSCNFPVVYRDGGNETRAVHRRIIGDFPFAHGIPRESQVLAHPGSSSRRNNTEAMQGEPDTSWASPIRRDRSTGYMTQGKIERYHRS